MALTIKEILDVLPEVAALHELLTLRQHWLEPPPPIDSSWQQPASIEPQVSTCPLIANWYEKMIDLETRLRQLKMAPLPQAATPN